MHLTDSVTLPRVDAFRHSRKRRQPRRDGLRIVEIRRPMLDHSRTLGHYMSHAQNSSRTRPPCFSRGGTTPGSGSDLAFLCNSHAVGRANPSPGPPITCWPYRRSALWRFLPTTWTHSHRSAGARNSVLRRIGRTALANYGLGGRATDAAALRAEHDLSGRYGRRAVRAAHQSTASAYAGHDRVRDGMAQRAKTRHRPRRTRTRYRSRRLARRRRPRPGRARAARLRPAALAQWAVHRPASHACASCASRRARGHLQKHAATWTPPSGFFRPRVDTLTDGAKVDSMAQSAAFARRGEHPTREDGDRSQQLVKALVSTNDAGLFGRALEVVRATTRKLAQETGTFGLIHADLHYENFLFHRSEEGRSTSTTAAGASTSTTSRSPCASWRVGYGTTSSGQRSSMPTRRSACCRTTTRPTSGHCSILRRMQILLWILQAREHAAFRDSVASMGA